MENLSKQSGSILIGAVFLLSIGLTIVFATLELSAYYDAASAVQVAGTLAADVARGQDFTKVSGQVAPYPSWLSWSNNAAPNSLYNLPLNFDLCQGRSAAGGGTPCPSGVAAANQLFTVPQGTYSSFITVPAGAKVDQLPFSLYDYDATTSYSQVQMLPLVGIKKACLEPFNETSTLINGSDCSVERPTYWQNDERADFDGDGKEDIVFFKPRGTEAPSYNLNPSDLGAYLSEVDFIVYYSASAYSRSAAGHGYFNLATACSGAGCPADIPIVADYDRDGKSDYAVFKPSTGAYNIALSTRGYKTDATNLVSGSITSDATGVRGLVAIPGRFTNSNKMEIAVIPTGASAAAGIDTRDRYSVYLIEPLAAAPAVSTLTSYKVKPHAGTSSVFAFADYNRDGVTEIGYLSWYNGNMAQRIAGKTVDANNLDPSSIPIFEDPAVSEKALDVRMHPYAITTDADDRIYYTDAIDGRVWMISPDQTETSVLINSEATVTRDTVGSFDLEDSLPEHSVWNIPDQVDPAPSTGYAVVAASKTELTNPRQIVVGPDYAVYVADYGGRRILRVYSGAASVVSSGDDAIEIMGSRGCLRGGCVDIADNTNYTQIGGSYDSTVFGQLNIKPIALAIVPDPTNSSAYHLAFSSGNKVFIIKTDLAAVSGRDGYGPRGAANELLVEVAGNGAGYGTIPISASVTPWSYKPDNLANARSSNICPIVDLKFDKFKYTNSSVASLIAASSCATIVGSGTTSTDIVSGDPDQIFDPSILEDVGTGGILRIEATDGAGASTNEFGAGNNKIDILAGNFGDVAYHDGTNFYWPYLYSTYWTGPPNPGNFQRKLNFSTTALATSNVDISNPVAVEVDPLGNILFVNQWNYQVNPNAYNIDHIRASGVYRINVKASSANNTIEAITNPAQIGNFTIPVQNADWYSPYKDTSGNLVSYVRAWEAPVKNFPFPASAGITLSADKSKIYAATPPLANTTSNTSDPYYTDQKQVGYIFQISLDTDYDGVSDFSSASTWSEPGSINDLDLDGDGIDNLTEATYPSRSLFCPEITTATTDRCRTQEKVGNPKWYAMPKDPASMTISVPIDTSSPSTITKQYLEYYLFNSVAEFLSSDHDARIETWATLLNINDAGRANGPIAMPQALHSLAGVADPASGAAYWSYKDSATPTAGRNFLFPMVTSGLFPKENGIKPVKRAWAGFGYDPSDIQIKYSGVLCWDYILRAYQGGVAGSFQKFAPFQFDYSNYFNNYVHSGTNDDEDGGDGSFPLRDTDNLNYFVTCTGSPNLADNRTTAQEAIVLQLNHDELSKVGISSSSTDVNWPAAFATGRTSTSAEDRRIFYMIDHDGNGARDASWISTESFSGATQNNPFELVTGGLDNSVVDRIYSARFPYSSANLAANSTALSTKILDDKLSYPQFISFNNLEGSSPAGITLFDPNHISFADRKGGFILGLDSEQSIISVPGTSEFSSAGSVSAYRDAAEQSNNKFVGGSASLAFKAAKTSLSSSLKISGPISSSGSSALNSQEARILLEPSGCENAGSESCAGIKIQYGIKVLGVVRTIEKTFSFKKTY